MGVEAEMSIFARNDEEFLREHIAHAEKWLNDPKVTSRVIRAGFESIKRQCQARLDALLSGNPLPEE